MPLTPTERELRASMGAHSRWAHEQDRAAATQPARDARMERYLATVDPEGRLPDDERQRRAESLRKADMARLSLLAVTAKRKRREKVAVAEAKARVAAEVEAELRAGLTAGGAGSAAVAS